MHAHELKELLDAVRRGQMTLQAAFERLRDLPFADLTVANVDHHRTLRTGFPEVILCEGKTPDEVGRIVAHMHARGGGILGTRCAPETYEPVAALVPGLHHNARARTFRTLEPVPPKLVGLVGVVSAGTADLHVAEEAVETLAATGVDVETIYDVGVAGLHRLLARRDRLDACDILIVVAGMEGALPSVVAGMSGKPTIAVPTSIGYGASFGGVAALLGMLNSCAIGVTVVNIDNGFGAAAAATVLLRQLRGPAERP
jgi:NCAIR mutase (PurE)-related protein